MCIFKLVCIYNATYALIIAYHDKFVGFRHFAATLAGYSNAVEIYSRLQLLPAISSEIPCCGICSSSAHCRFVASPKQSATGIKHINVYIHRCAYAVVVDDKCSRRCGRIVSYTDAKQARSESAHDIEIERYRRRVVENIPSSKS